GAGATLAKGALIFMATEKLKFAAIVALILILSIGGAVSFVSHRAAKRMAQRPSPTSSHWPAKFRDGTSVEIIAIRDSKRPDEWWALDGSIVADPDFRAPSAISMKFS